MPRRTPRLTGWNLYEPKTVKKGKPPADVWVELDDTRGTPFTVARFRFTISRGQVVCAGVHLEVPSLRPITAREVRLYPLAELIAIASHAAVDLAGWKLSEARLVRQRGRKGHPPDLYEQVAEIYWAASAQPERSRIRWMVDELRRRGEWVEPWTVRRWVATARDMGLIEDEPRPAMKRKKGGKRGR